MICTPSLIKIIVIGKIKSIERDKVVVFFIYFV